jgi:hypothetical protein
MEGANRKKLHTRGNIKKKNHKGQTLLLYLGTKWSELENKVKKP